MSKEAGFTKIRNGLREHIKKGKFKGPFDLGVYVFLQMECDWSTGIYHGTALGIAYGFDDSTLRAHIQKALARLRTSGYINYPSGTGKRCAYDILIDKFEPTTGRWVGKRLNAWKHGNEVRPEYEPIMTQSVDRPFEETTKVAPVTTTGRLVTPKENPQFPARCELLSNDSSNGTYEAPGKKSGMVPATVPVVVPGPVKGQCRRSIPDIPDSPDVLDESDDQTNDVVRTFTPSIETRDNDSIPVIGIGPVPGNFNFNSVPTNGTLPLGFDKWSDEWRQAYWNRPKAAPVSKNNKHVPVIPAQPANFDPLNFKEPLGAVPGSEVHRVLYYQWRVNENDYWRSDKGDITNRVRLEAAFPSMLKQTPKDFVIPGSFTRPERVINPACPKCHGRGDVLVDHPAYPPGMFLMGEECICVTYREQVLK